jgi:hypothetical protein
MLKVVKLDSQILQISCDCAESDGGHEDANRMVFALNPKPALSANSLDQPEAQKAAYDFDGEFYLFWLDAHDFCRK